MSSSPGFGEAGPFSLREEGEVGPFSSSAGPEMRGWRFEPRL